MEQVPFEVEVDRQANRLSVKVSGELDFSNASKLQSILQSEIDSPGTTLVFDFSHVTFLDSEGMKVIVAAYRKMAEAGGRIAVTGCSDPVGRLFDILGLRSLLGVTCGGASDSRDRDVNYS
jgi:anti-anti-sigma factor